MTPEEEQPVLIYEARGEKMVSWEDGEASVRIARFLKPCARHVSSAVGVPSTPSLLSEIFSHHLQQWPSKVFFKGWRLPQKKWKEWVDRLAEKYGAIWNQTGICDAITSSMYDMRCNQDVVLGLSEFWCSETNTFVFPWGEATITLEDVMILGGFPVLGQPVTSPVTGEPLKIEAAMEDYRTKLLRSKAKKALHSGWLRHFMEEETGFEHVAFLSLWLSRYVFPSLPEETIGKHVFPIAVHLSLGNKVALGPAVLASLYQGLRVLKEQAMASSESITVLGPFQLVQLWAFERFPLMGSNSPNPLQPGEPRAARWHKLSSKLNLPLARSVLRLPQNFQWRPYAVNLRNWKHPLFYQDTEQLLSNGSSLDDELRAFLGCLRATELVGLGCKEKYLPHRVAMQLGMDQDLPGHISDFNSTVENISFFVTSRLFNPGVSVRYYNWWKDCMCARKKESKAAESKMSAQEKLNEDYLANSMPHASSVSITTVRSEIFPRSIQMKNCRDGGHAPFSWRTPNDFVRVHKNAVSIVPLQKRKDHNTNSMHQANAAGAGVGTTTKSEIHPSIDAKSCKSDGHAATSSRTVKGPQYLSQVSSKSSVEGYRVPVTSGLMKFHSCADGRNKEVGSANLEIQASAASGKAMKSEMFPSIQRKYCKNDCNAPVSLRTVKGPEQLSQVSSVSNIEERCHTPFISELPSKSIFQGLSDDDIVLAKRLKPLSGASGRNKEVYSANSKVQSSAAGKKNMESEIFPSVWAKKCKGDNAVVLPRIMKNAEELSQIFSKSYVEESDAIEFPPKLIFQDSNQNNTMIRKRLKLHSGVTNEKRSSCEAFLCHQSKNYIFAPIGFANKSCRKRRSLTRTERNSQGKATNISLISKVDKEPERKGDALVFTEVNGKACDSADDPLDFVILSKRIKHGQGAIEKIRGLNGEGKGKNAGRIFRTPSNVDGCLETVRSTFCKPRPDIEGRIQNLEKLLGLIP